VTRRVSVPLRGHRRGHVAVAIVRPGLFFAGCQKRVLFLALLGRYRYCASADIALAN